MFVEGCYSICEYLWWVWEVELNNSMCEYLWYLLEVVIRFENQGDTTRHLEELKKDNEKQIGRLREEKDKLQQEFEEMK